MTGLSMLEVLAGFLIVATVLWDLFQSVVLPRPAVGRLRLSTNLAQALWRVWRAVGTRIPSQGRRETALAVYGPMSVIILLLVWVLCLVGGYALILFGLADQITPPPRDYGQAVYVSSLAIFTLGFGDVVPSGTAARIIVMFEAASGLGVFALVISLLFSLFSSFQRREVLVISLDASAGAPPSGLQLLETCAKYEIPEHLNQVFQDWRTWSAEVLESHLAYPILNFFRSSHDNEAWLNSFGAVMDAAVLLVAVVDAGPQGQARLLLKIGEHLVEDLAWYFRLPHEHMVGVDRSEFDLARARLAKAGYPLREAESSWQAFCDLRRVYAAPLNRMALNLVIPGAQWIGDRSYLPHLDAVDGHRNRT